MQGLTVRIFCETSQSLYPSSWNLPVYIIFRTPTWFLVVTPPPICYCTWTRILLACHLRNLCRISATCALFTLGTRFISWYFPGVWLNQLNQHFKEIFKSISNCGRLPKKKKILWKDKQILGFFQRTKNAMSIIAIVIGALGKGPKDWRNLKAEEDLRSYRPLHVWERQEYSTELWRPKEICSHSDSS